MEGYPEKTVETNQVGVHVGTGGLLPPGRFLREGLFGVSKFPTKNKKKWGT